MGNNPKCWHYTSKSEEGKESCPNCHHWDSAKGRCKDEALLLAEWEEKHGVFDRMMRGNKGVKL